MKTTFSERHVAAMKVMGLPTDLDEFFSASMDVFCDYCDAIERELLGPGLDLSGELNEYGDALRSALDAIARRDYEINGPMDIDAILSEV